MGELTESILTLVAVIISIALWGLLFAFPVMWCWNYAVVSVFHLSQITWGQAWCLMFLFGVFLKSSLSVTK